MLCATVACRRSNSAGRRRLGSYIVDFLCISNKIVVEVDGSQHGENRRDQIRDAWLEREGYRVMRFWNHEVTFNQEGVLATIAAACGLP